MFGAVVSSGFEVGLFPKVSAFNRVDIVAVRSGVQIDVCNKCGAKFLDNGELLKIREGGMVDTTKADALMDTLYKENLRSVLGENADRPVKSSPRRQFFEDLARRFI